MRRAASATVPPLRRRGCKQPGHDPALLEARRRAEALSAPRRHGHTAPDSWHHADRLAHGTLRAVLCAPCAAHGRSAQPTRNWRMLSSRKWQTLLQATRPAGIGFSHNFLPDGDDTAAGLAVLAACGCPVSPSILAPFEHATHFSVYPFEFHIARTVITARAAHALRICGHDVARWQETIVSGTTCGRFMGRRQMEYVTPVRLQHRPHGLARRTLSGSQGAVPQSLDCHPTAGWRLG